MIKDSRTLFLVLPVFLLSCQSSDSSRSDTSEFEIRFIEQSICDAESIPDNLSVFQLDDQLTIGEQVRLDNTGTAEFEVNADTGSFMVIRETADGVDVYVATDIDTDELGTWYFDTNETAGCNVPAVPYEIEVKPGNDNAQHINWPAAAPSPLSSDSATYSNVDYLYKLSETSGLLVAFANVSSELVYFVSDDPADLASAGKITVDLNDANTHSTDVQAVNINNADTSRGRFYYASDDIYEFYAGYDTLTGANLLLDDRTTPLFFQTSAQLTSSAPTIQWRVRQPISISTSSITYATPEVSNDLQSRLSALVQKTTTSFNFSTDQNHDQNFDAFVEFYTIADSGNTDHWTIVKGTSGSLFTQFVLPDGYTRSDSYSDNITDTELSLVDFRNYEGYLHSDQGLALRDLFRQSDSNQLTTLEPRAEELDMEIHEVAVSYTN